MDFELTDEQVALQEGVRSFLRGPLPDRRPCASSADQGGIDRGLWRELADMGIFALRLPEADGGVGLGWADAVLVFEELGRVLVPGPLVWTHLAGRASCHGAATGETIVDGIDRDDPRGIVEYPGGIDVLVVARRRRPLVGRRVRPRRRPTLTPLDPLTPVGPPDRRRCPRVSRSATPDGGRRRCGCGARRSSPVCLLGHRRGDRPTSRSPTPRSATSSTGRSARSRRSST